MFCRFPFALHSFSPDRTLGVQKLFSNSRVEKKYQQAKEQRCKGRATHTQHINIIKRHLLGRGNE